MRETSIHDDFTKIEDMKEFYPTEEEFREPLKYIQKLYE
jgi:hypothetical protein